MKFEQESAYLTIGAAAKQLGVAEHSLRYWEKLKLISPMRVNSGHRRYRKSDLKTAAIVLTLLKKGYSPKSILELLRQSGRKKLAASSDFINSARRKEVLEEIKRECTELISFLAKL